MHQCRKEHCEMEMVYLSIKCYPSRLSFIHALRISTLALIRLITCENSKLTCRNNTYHSLLTCLLAHLHCSQKSEPCEILTCQALNGK